MCDVVGGCGRIHGSMCHHDGMKDIGFTLGGVSVHFYTLNSIKTASLPAIFISLCVLTTNS